MHRRKRSQTTERGLLRRYEVLKAIDTFGKSCSGTRGWVYINLVDWDGHAAETNNRIEGSERIDP